LKKRRPARGSKKLLVLRALAHAGQAPAGAEVFLLLFFSKKEALCLVCDSAGKAWMPAFAGMTGVGACGELIVCRVAVLPDAALYLFSRLMYDRIP
jgi:hypothetical protein